MAAAGYSTILLYSSSTPGNTPTAGNLTTSAMGAEVAINVADGKLFFKNTSGAVTVLANQAMANPASVAITGGSINGTTVGATTASTGNFTTLGVSSALTIAPSTPIMLSSSAGTSGQVLTSAGAGATPTWTTPTTGTVTSVAVSVPAFLSVSGSPVTTNGTIAISLSGTALPVANGGTGATSLTGYLVGNGTSAVTAVSTIPNTGLTNSSLTVNGTLISLGGSGTVTAAAGTLTGATLASNVLASSLTSVGTLSALTVTATITGSVSGNAGTATLATNVAGGAAGSIHYQSAANTTAMLAAGSGVLVESGGAPSWSLTPTLTSVTTTGFTALGNAVTQSAPSTTAIATTAALSVAENGGNGLWVGQNTSGNSFAVWMQSSFTNPTTAVYPMALNPLGGNVGINTGNTAPTSNLQVNGSIAGSTMSLSGGMYFSNAASVAAAGTTQGTATVLTADTNAVTSGTGGVVLPSGVGREITVINRTGSAVNVYPASGYSIDGAGTNAATSVPPNAWITVNCLTSTNYYTIDPVFTAGTGMSITQSNNGTVTFGVSTVPVGNGGTGITGTPANGQIPIGNGTNYTLATLTAGTNVTITNSAGSITINASGGGGSSPPGAQVVTALYFGAL